jgi:hypothetical protein
METGYFQIFGLYIVFNYLCYFCPPLSWIIESLLAETSVRIAPGAGLHYRHNGKAHQAQNSNAEI